MTRYIFVTFTNRAYYSDIIMMNIDIRYVLVRNHFFGNEPVYSIIEYHLLLKELDDNLLLKVSVHDRDSPCEYDVNTFLSNRVSISSEADMMLLSQYVYIINLYDGLRVGGMHYDIGIDSLHIYSEDKKDYVTLPDIEFIKLSNSINLGRYTFIYMDNIDLYYAISTELYNLIVRSKQEQWDKLLSIGICNTENKEPYEYSLIISQDVYQSIFDIVHSGLSYMILQSYLLFINSNYRIGIDCIYYNDIIAIDYRKVSISETILNILRYIIENY